MSVITRFAPSPTGFMHIGGMRTALFAYLWAKKHGGTFILRIEDTDRERRVEGSVEHIIESLRWLNLDWDYGPDKPGPFGSTIQSERLETYRASAQVLIDKGFAYTDPYSPEELQVLRDKAQQEKRPFLFREHRPENPEPWDGNRPLRFRVPEIKRYHWHDEVRGDLEAGEEALDDFILLKSDGFPTYNFAHILDDHAMGVNFIFRADEFISSTPRFLSLYDALEIPYPKFVTLPPILRDDKTKKLGKRDGAKDILEYRNEGYLPDAMANFLALIGWNPGGERELFDRAALLEHFHIHQIQAHGGVVNEEKLRWFNREYLKRMSDDDFLEYITPAVVALRTHHIEPDRTILSAMLPILRTAGDTRKDIENTAGEGGYNFFFQDPIIDPTLLPEKKSTRRRQKPIFSALSIS